MNNLISRDAALDAIDKNRQDLLSLGMDGAEHILVHYGRRVIEELLTAEKVEKWIVDEKRFGDTERHCSLCGAILEGDDWKWRNNNYCYHCGARMVRGEEE